MNKNTIIAIVLSTIVVLASLILQPMLFPNTANNVAESENVTEETSAVKVEEDKLAWLRESLEWQKRFKSYCRRRI